MLKNTGIERALAIGVIIILKSTEDGKNSVGHVFRESKQGQTKEKGGRFQPLVPAAEQEKLLRPAWERIDLLCTQGQG